jgi:Domain of unknown function (DUF4105)
MRFLQKGLFFFICLSGLFANAQNDSSRLRISLLTCTPGAELYSIFGHTAIRITDSAINSDIVYNYGTFNFDDDGFYLKFVQGKLLYHLSAEYFGDFKYFYQQEQRGITEQLLNLSVTEKRNLQQALEKNLEPANRYYKYDFFFDNCTTRARDMVIEYKDSVAPFKASMPQGTRFRQGIHTYLDKNNNYWSKLGIDILLGAPTDAVMTNTTMQFLPDNLMKSFDSCRAPQVLVKSKTSLYPVETTVDVLTIFTPTVTFSLLLALFVLLSFIKVKPARILLNILDMLLFFLAGLLGVILIFMWTGTDHAMCRNNYNLLWAWPTQLIMAFFIFSHKKWVKKYFGFTAAALLLVLISWFFLPQQMNNALIPVVLLLIYRSAAKYFRQQSLFSNLQHDSKRISIQQ